MSLRMLVALRALGKRRLEPARSFSHRDFRRQALKLALLNEHDSDVVKGSQQCV